MIYFARLLSLIGGVVTSGGMLTIFAMSVFEFNDLIPEEFQYLWLLVLSATFLGAVMLLIGQLCGNDLFKVRGKDSIVALRIEPNDPNSFF